MYLDVGGTNYKGRRPASLARPEYETDNGDIDITILWAGKLLFIIDS
jgi:hypothetical protein